MSEGLRSAVPSLSQAAKCKPSGMQHRVCRMQICMQERRETTSITDGDRAAFARGADRNAFAHTRSNAEHNSIPNTHGAYANAVTPITRELKKSGDEQSDRFGCSFRLNVATFL